MRTIRNRVYGTIFPQKAFPYKNYYFSTNLKLIYLAIPKNANSFFRAVFFMHSENATGFRPLEETAVEYLRRTPAARLRIPSVRALDDPGCTKMMILRNPFNRLVSAYLDKFVKTAANPPETARHYIRGASKKLAKVITPATFTFADFLRYTATLDDKQLDTHWVPQVRFLAGHTFDFYGDVENIAPTYNFLRERYGIDAEAALS